LIDEIGVDVSVDIADTLERAYGRRDRVPQILREMVSAKMLGRKSGSGFYRYEGKRQTKNAEIEKWRQVSPSSAQAHIADRLVFLMVNEAARCLEEKVVRSPEDADYGMILGTGFAPFRGGPLRFAEHYGINRLVEELERLAQEEEKFAPAEILKQHAGDGTKFYEDTARSAA
jgi:3-hydroxyacyl-CoA dehydrogenase / enoyl-CoA hydratase / 3-hydroxybutyryl-CoA epimerase